MSEIVAVDGYSAPKAGMSAHGKIETIVYFEAPDHHLIIAFHTGQPTPIGYMRCEATTLREADTLSQRYAEQQMRRFKAMDESEMARRETFFQGCIDRAKATCKSNLCTQKEREFLQTKLIPNWDRMKQETKIYREFCFRQEKFEATNSGDD